MRYTYHNDDNPNYIMVWKDCENEAVPLSSWVATVPCDKFRTVSRVKYDSNDSVLITGPDKITSVIMSNEEFLDMIRSFALKEKHLKVVRNTTVQFLVRKEDSHG